MRAFQKNGSVVLNEREGRVSTWNFLWWESGKRKSRLLGSIIELPQREDAERKAAPLRRQLNRSQIRQVPRVVDLVDNFREEKMSSRLSTRLACESRLRNHIIPQWGEVKVTEMQARPVELWLKSLSLSPKTRVHIRGLIRQLWDYAMWRGDVPTDRNPMELVTIKGATKRQRKPRSLPIEEFKRFVACLEEPLRTIALVGGSFGLRISEALALKWSDVDWLGTRLRVERAIVRQTVGDVKTANSTRAMSIDVEMIAILKSWRQTTQFADDGDWIFASPCQLGRLPVSYPWVWRSFQDAARRAGIEKVGTHSLRHSYRSWLDAVGTPIAVQQKLMRHSDIRTTMNTYGDVVTDEMEPAQSKVARLVLAKQ